MNQIHISENKDFTAQYPDALITEFEVVTQSGKKWVQRTGHPRGHSKNPMSDEEVEAKFNGLCQELLTPQQAQSIMAATWHLDEVQDVGSLVELVQV